LAILKQGTNSNPKEFDFDFLRSCSDNQRVKVLFVTQRCPYPMPLDPVLQSRAQRESMLIDALLTEFSTELLCLRKRHGESYPSADLMPAQLNLSQITAEPATLTSRAAALMLRFVDHFRAEPFSQEFADAIEVRQASRILWLSGLNMLSYLPVALDHGFIPILDLHHFSPPETARGLASLWKLPRRLGQAGYWNLFQRETLSQLAAIVVAHEREKKLLQDAVGSAEFFPKIHVIHDGIDMNQFRPLQSNSGKRLLFILPKDLSSARSTLTWLNHEIFPRLLPNLKMQQTEFALEGVRVLGPMPLKKTLSEIAQKFGVEWITDRTLHLDSPHGPIAESKLVVFPMYARKHSSDNRARAHSTGVADLRILESMAAGRAVICTPIAAQGFDLMPGHEAWIAEHPDALTSSILKLLHSPDIRIATEKSAVAALECRHETSPVRKQVFDLLNQLDLYLPRK